MTAEQPKRTMIRPASGWPGFALREFWDLRAICLVLAKRNLMVRYRQTLVGAGWSLIQPILLMLAFTVFFGILGRVPSEGLPYPLFFFLGLVPWQMVAKILNEGSGSIVANNTLVTRVYLPRVYFPTSVALASLVDFTLAATVLGLLLVAFGVMPDPTVILLPLFIAVAWITGLGAAYWLSALNVAYRDITLLVPFLTQMGMFVSPIIYPASLIPEPFDVVYFLNPMAFVVTGFRWSIAGATPPPPEAWLVAPIVAIALLISGYVFFRYRERTFSDLV